MHHHASLAHDDEHKAGPRHTQVSLPARPTISDPQWKLAPHLCSPRARENDDESDIDTTSDDVCVGTEGSASGGVRDSDAVQFSRHEPVNSGAGHVRSTRREGKGEGKG